jgi:flagellar L-ring protein precursor FlgH
MNNPMQRTAAAVALLALLPAATLTSQSLYRNAGAPRASLIADLRAGAIGDILTVIIREQHKVENRERTDRSNETSLSAKLDALEVGKGIFTELPELGVSQSRSFRGDARQQNDSTMEARIAVTVLDVLPNGNLVVSGRRTVRNHDEEKTLRVSGVVRPQDVTAANTVLSSQVAEARVAIEGEGGNTQYTTRGPVGQFFHMLWWVLWPF